jgi:hypothetical protein
MFGRYAKSPAVDIGLRLLLAAVALVALFHPNDVFAWLPGLLALAGVLAGLWRHRLIAPPKEPLPEAAEGPAAPSGDMSALVAEARRDLG